MRKLFNIILCTALVAAMTSCEKFFTREPINEFSSETYFSNENELNMYAVGMLNSWLPDYTETSGGDAYNDLIATKTSTEFFRADVVWDDAKQGSWSWSFARRVNYMLEGMAKNGGKIQKDIYNHYEGVARFWRAYNYISRVKTFSNVPWLDHVIQPNEDDILYGDREDREYIVHMIVEDLKFACDNVMAGKFHGASGTTRNQIDKYVVNALAARFFLYEGTYRLNHKINHATGKEWNGKYESATELLELAAKSAKLIIDEGGFSLHPNYAELFTSPVLCADEVIWGQVQDPNVNGRHALTRYFNSSTLGQQYSGTKPLVHHFLKADGTPIATDEVSFTEEFKDRDPRLSATILSPGYKHLSLATNDMQPKPINCTFCKTGYMLVKWNIPDETHMQNGVDENSIPIVRYAEVLLIYAEAMNELGKFDKSVWDLTVGALRTRAGVKSIYPTAADPWLKSYYTEDVNNTHITEGNEAVALEIRRERVAELTFEGGLRQDDLYRWAQCDLIERRYKHQGWAGIWISDAEKASGFSFAGNTYTFGPGNSVNSETNYPISDTNNLNWSLEKAGAGWYLVYNYKLQWNDEKMYVRPIPATAKVVNPNITESYGW